jgi:hypothetical protein
MASTLAAAAGGVNWQRAQLHDPVLSKALTLFALPWHWDGRAGTAAIPRHRRDRLRSADHYAVAKAARIELGLSHQFDPDLAGQNGRERVQCSVLVDTEPSLRGAKRRSNPGFLRGLWIASRSLSSGAHSRDPFGSQ